MSDKHLETGSTLPPTKQDTLRIYSMRFCPYAQRTRLVLAHKQIPHETVNVNLKRKPEWFFDKNPGGMVPVLEINDQIIYESAICDEYLDEKYPNNKLLPEDPYLKARAKILMDGFAKVITGFYGALRGSGDVRAKCLDEIPTLLDKYEKALTGKFFGGDSPNMLDAHIWPWVERFPTVKELSGVDIITADRFPKLKQWVEDMKTTPMVKGSFCTPEQHTRFVRSYMEGEPEYDP